MLKTEYGIQRQRPSTDPLDEMFVGPFKTLEEATSYRDHYNGTDPEDHWVVVSRSVTLWESVAAGAWPEED